MSRTTKLVMPLVVWTVLVWASRIRNIWGDEELTTGGQLIRTGIALVFLAFGVALGAVAWRHRRAGALGAGERRLLVAAVVWTIGFWLVRGIGIIVDDHTLGFTVIHTVLMVISIALAWLALRALPAGSRSISSSPVAAQ